MSENVVICTECGRERPKQVLVCGRHDFRHEEGTHCDHCENEFAEKLVAAADAAAKGANESTT